MKKSSLIAIMATSATMIGMALSAHAQNSSPYWSLAGNSNATSTGSKLGTTNAVPLRLFTNNSTRLFIDANTGNVGVNTGSSASSVYKLYVVGSNSGIYGRGSSTYGVFGQGGTYGVYGTGSSYGVYGTTTNGYGVAGISTNNYGLYGNSTRSYGFYGHSTTGYGGIAISDSSDGFDAYASTGYFGVYASCGNPSGYGSFGYSPYIGVYGNGGSFGTYGYSYSGQGIRGESTIGLGGFFHSSSSWALEATTDSGYYAGVFFGYVYASQGFITSDRRLKKNIEDFGDAMSIINRLQPKHYEFKNDARYAGLHLPSGMHYGLIAQDLEQVLPNLVHEEKFDVPVKNNPVIVKPKSPDGKDENQYQNAAAAVKAQSMDVKAVNYEELIPIMIKAMQEQNAKIEALTQQVNALTASKQPGISNTAIKLSNAYLGQSAPNPTTGVASIQYNNLPAGARAQLLVSDANGKLIKQMQLGSNSGTVSLDVSSLSPGTYTYSLLVNGGLVQTKSMQVAR